MFTHAWYQEATKALTRASDLETNNLELIRRNNELQQLVDTKPAELNQELLDEVESLRERVAKQYDNLDVYEGIMSQSWRETNNLRRERNQALRRYESLAKSNDEHCARANTAEARVEKLEADLTRHESMLARSRRETDNMRRRAAVLRKESDNMRIERDLALAHDTQDYPTVDAYDRVYNARHKWHDRAIAAEALVLKLEEKLDDPALPDSWNARTIKAESRVARLETQLIESETRRDSFRALALGNAEDAKFWKGKAENLEAKLNISAAPSPWHDRARRAEMSEAELIGVLIRISKANITCTTADQLQDIATKYLSVTRCDVLERATTMEYSRLMFETLQFIVKGDASKGSSSQTLYWAQCQAQSTLNVMNRPG